MSPANNVALGACRTTDGVVTCKCHLPPSLNWAKLLEVDYLASNTTGSQVDVIEACMTLIQDRGVNHASSAGLSGKALRDRHDLHRAGRELRRDLNRASL